MRFCRYVQGKESFLYLGKPTVYLIINSSVITIEFRHWFTLFMISKALFKYNCVYKIIYMVKLTLNL